MQKTLSFCLVVMVSLRISAQQTALRSLQIGDTVPDVPFQEFLDNTAPPVQLAGSKGRLVILDFWNVGCLACLHGMPKMDSLQKQFGDRIQIILITYNKREEVEKLFSRIKIQKPSLPIVVEDTNYYKTMFPHVGDPLHVWINEKGVITAITDGHNATVSHVQAMLEGRKLNLSTRAPEGPFVGRIGLLEASVGPLKNYVNSYSIVLKNLNQQTTSNSVILQRDTATHQLQKITAINTPLITLYAYAYARELFGFDVNLQNLPKNNRIVVETANPLDVRRPKADSVMDVWNARNLWSYEAQVKPSEGPTLASVLQADLEKYTGFTAKIEERIMKCLVLKRTSRKDKLHTADKNKFSETYFNDAFVMQNMTLQSSLLPHLVIVCQEMPYPVIDETHYTAPVDLRLEAAGNNLEDVNKALRRYDLVLAVEVRKAKMLVIRNKKYSSR